MATRINTALRDSQAANAGSEFDAGDLEVRVGTQPTTANDVATGTLLCEIIIPATAFGAPSTGVVAKAGTWSGTVLATGTPGWFRLRNAGDTVRLDGAITGEMTISGLVGGELIAGGTLTIDTFTITQPAS